MVKRTPISANVRASAGCYTLLQTRPRTHNIEGTDEAVTTSAAPKAIRMQPEPENGDKQRPQQAKSKTSRLNENTVIF